MGAHLDQSLVKALVKKESTTIAKPEAIYIRRWWVSESTEVLIKKVTIYGI